MRYWFMVRNVEGTAGGLMSLTQLQAQRVHLYEVLMKILVIVSLH